MERVAIVTDTSSDLSPRELEQLDVRCVVLNVTRADGAPFPANNTPADIEAFNDYMERCDELPKTSMPSPVEFAELYTQLALEGHTHVLSVHITRAMSGTADAARMAAQSAALEVAVVETRRNTWALGLMVRRLSQMRAAGCSFGELVEAAGTLYTRCDVVFTIDTLKNLVKGGRAGKAAGLAAALLDIKPVLTVDDDGEVVELCKVRSMKRALRKLAQVAAGLEGRLGALEGYFVHVRNESAVDVLREQFVQAGVAFKELGVRQVGPIIATHVGIGTVGFSYIAQEA